MARSQYAKQVARLRSFLVIVYIVLATLSLGLAFLLSWYEKPGAPWFVGTTVIFGLWAAVTATCSRVTAGDFLGVAKVVGIDRLRTEKEAA